MQPKKLNKVIFQKTEHRIWLVSEARRLAHGWSTAIVNEVQKQNVINDTIFPVMQ